MSMTIKILTPVRIENNLQLFGIAKKMGILVKTSAQNAQYRPTTLQYIKLKCLKMSFFPFLRMMGYIPATNVSKLTITKK